MVGIEWAGAPVAHGKFMPVVMAPRVREDGSEKGPQGGTRKVSLSVPLLALRFQVFLV